MANEIKKVNTIEITDIKKVNTITDDNLKKLNTLEFTGLASTFYGTTAVIAMGATRTESMSNRMEHRTIGSSSDAADFGDLQSGRKDGLGAGSNISRGIFAGGLTLADTSIVYGTTDTDYITVGSAANAQDFGNLDAVKAYGARGGSSNGTLLFSAGGGQFISGSTYYDTMEYFTIASSPHDGTDGGKDLAGDGNARTQFAGTDGLTKGLIAGGKDASFASVNTIQEFTFSTSANTEDFGDLSQVAFECSAVEDLTRAVFQIGFGNNGSADTVVVDTEYVDIASDTNASDHGDLTSARQRVSGASNGVLGEFYGGQPQGAAPNEEIIEKITIQSAGTASADTNAGFSVGDISGQCEGGSALSGT
tara:strand:+ start:784 stop:1875 length:1092 start_codon:yes stop_codon:yes gene_type:complete